VIPWESFVTVARGGQADRIDALVKAAQQMSNDE